MNQTNSVPNPFLVPETLGQAQQWLTENGLNLAGRLVGAVLLFVIGRWLARAISRGVARVLEKREVDGAVSAFVRNIVFVAMVVFVFIAALGLLGVPTASFVTVLGAAGLAIGLALQGSLSNFAAGFLLILFRPFRKGDFIEGGGTAGLVEEIQIFNTILNTPDNKKVIIPNAKLTGDNIINFSARDTRRIDFTFGVSYADDIRKVKEVLTRLVAADDRMLKDPAPRIAVAALADSSVNFTVRVWVRSDQYWDVFFDTVEKVKLTFDAEGITIPFPQRDVHLHSRND